MTARPNRRKICTLLEVSRLYASSPQDVRDTLRVEMNGLALAAQPGGGAADTGVNTLNGKRIDEREIHGIPDDGSNVIPGGGGIGARPRDRRARRPGPGQIE